MSGWYRWIEVRSGALAAVTVTALLLVGCGSTALHRAPVADRGAGVGSPPSVDMDASASSVKQPPGFENAGKPGYYAVKQGDTLIRIGLDHGQSWRDIARWSGVENPDKIEVGQVLRVTPIVAALAPAGIAVTKPVILSSLYPGALPAQSASAAKVAAVPAPVVASANGAPTVAGEDEIAWIWPTSGVVLTGFDEVKNKGLDIGGAAGDAVLAASDGRVVYVGAGLRGYGNLIILKHNNTYLTAYAHNQSLLVKEDQSVRKGQKIAEMGNSDSDRVKLHFEVRRQGKPVDPAKYLPAR
jgi:lipoprotein NlpD